MHTVFQSLIKKKHCSSATLKWNKQPSDDKEVGYTIGLIKLIQNNKEDLEIQMEDDEKRLIKKQVNVLKAVNPSEIYFSFDEDKIKLRLHEMSAELQEFYTANKVKNCPTLEMNTPCVVFHKETNKYQRAYVISLDETTCTVSLRDAADKLTLSKKSVLALEMAFNKYPSFALRCHLQGISPAGDVKKWSHLAIEYIQELFKKEKKVFITKAGELDVEMNSLPVTMWYLEFIPGGPLEPSTNKLHSINRLLVNNGLALNTRSLSKPKQNVSDVPEKVVVEEKVEEEEPILVIICLYFILNKMLHITKIMYGIT